MKKGRIPLRIRSVGNMGWEKEKGKKTACNRVEGWATNKTEKKERRGVKSKKGIQGKERMKRGSKMLGGGRKIRLVAGDCNDEEY